MTRLVIYFNELRAWGERLENSSVPQAQCSLRGMSGEEYSWAYLCKKEKKHETSNLVNFMVSLHFKYLWGFNRGRGALNALVFWNLVTSSWTGNMMERLKIRLLDLCSLTWQQRCFHVVQEFTRLTAEQPCRRQRQTFTSTPLRCLNSLNHLSKIQSSAT